MAEEYSVLTNSLPKNSPAALAGEYLRAFAGTTRRMGDFDDFYEALRELVHDDGYLAGAAEISDDTNAPGAVPDFDDLDSSETVVSLSGPCGSAGYLHYRGRRDGEAFEAEDLHLMGAIAGFVSVLTAQAQKFRKKDESSRVFQYLINQLPLGVLCFDAQSGMLVENKLAKRLLGDDGAGLIRNALSEEALKDRGKLRMHLEVGGKLLYAEGRCLDVDEKLSVHAFVLHDMSGQREKNRLQLERSVFRAESRKTPLTVAVLEDRSEAGRLYRLLKASADPLQLEADGILTLDAYTCACVFAGKRLRSARYLLKNGLPQPIDRESTQGALLSEWTGLDETSPAQSLIDTARAGMQPLAELLRPALLVLDPYPGTLQSLEWIGGEIASFQAVDDAIGATLRVESGRFDGIFVDIDAFGLAGLEWLHSASQQAGGGFRAFYVSHKQPSMVYADYALAEDQIVLQKPFDTEKLRETLALQFDFA